MAPGVPAHHVERADPRDERHDRGPRREQPAVIRDRMRGAHGIRSDPTELDVAPDTDARRSTVARFATPASTASPWTTRLLEQLALLRAMLNGAARPAGATCARTG